MKKRLKPLAALAAMQLLFFATIGFLVCGFFIYVLVQWMRETLRKARTPSRIDNSSNELSEKSRLRIVGPQTRK